MRVDANKIIALGDVDLLVQTAQDLGTSIARQLSTNQVRNIFGEVRRIEALWPPFREEWSDEDRKNAQDAYRRAVLLRPKLAYQARKERGQGIEMLQAALEPCLEVIQSAQSDKDRKLYFDHFVDFFEAILAYHKAAGGN